MILYPAIWLTTTVVTACVRRKDLLMQDERLRTDPAVLDELRVKQKRVQRRLRRLLLSKEAILGRSLIIRVRKTGVDPFDA